MNEGARRQVDAEIAAAQLEHEARRFVLVAEHVARGDTSQALLRARRQALYAAAREFCRAASAAH